MAIDDVETHALAEGVGWARLWRKRHAIRFQLFNDGITNARTSIIDTRNRELFGAAMGRDV